MSGIVYIIEEEFLDKINNFNFILLYGIFGFGSKFLLNVSVLKVVFLYTWFI